MRSLKTHTDSCYTQLSAEDSEDPDGDPAELPLTCTITDETHVHGPPLLRDMGADLRAGGTHAYGGLLFDRGYASRRRR